MTDIIIKTQADLDALPDTFQEFTRIIIQNDPTQGVIQISKIYNNASVYVYNKSSVQVSDNSSVYAYDKSLVYASGNSSVKAYDNSLVQASGNSSVKAYDNSLVQASGNSSVQASGNSSVYAYEHSSVHAYDNSSVYAYGNSSAHTHDNSSVQAQSSCHVVNKNKDKEVKNKAIINIDQAVLRACQEPSLPKALSWIAIWETERVIGQALRYKETGISTASHGGGWDTCFEYCFSRVITEWNN